MGKKSKQTNDYAILIRPCFWFHCSRCHRVDSSASKCLHVCYGVCHWDIARLHFHRRRWRWSVLLFNFFTSIFGCTQAFYLTCDSILYLLYVSMLSSVILHLSSGSVIALSFITLLFFSPLFIKAYISFYFSNIFHACHPCACVRLA